MRSKSLSYAALVILIGMLVSGPIGSFIIQLLKPEPAWADAETYIQHYSVLQSIPFYFGFLMMGGFLLFFASLPEPKNELDRILIRITFLFASIYTFMISMNYLMQISLLPNILEYPKVVEMIATLNAKSQFWYIEMTGYGFLGLATGSAGLLFRETKRNEIIKWICLLNAIISVIGSVLTFIFKGWVLSLPGLLSYVIWNLLIMLLTLFIMVEYRFGKTSSKI